MKDVNEDLRLKILAIQAQNEQDSEKLLELVREINALIDAKRNLKAKAKEEP